MRSKPKLDLSTFDGQLLDGLDFCKDVYDLFDQVKAGVDGTRRLRLRPTKLEKRLVEELIPIARYVQARYREGRRIKVRWFSGSQPFDAVLWSFGELVKQKMARRKVVVEVTTSVHPNDHLRRKLLDERGGCFSVKGIMRDKKTGTVISNPQVHNGHEIAIDLADQILDRLRSKGAKKYPAETVLIINCVANGLTLPSEWNDAIERVNQAKIAFTFREVFLIEAVMSHSTTLYGGQKRPQRVKLGL
jgi:hypothetical protein